MAQIRVVSTFCAECLFQKGQFKQNLSESQIKLKAEYNKAARFGKEEHIKFLRKNWKSYLSMIKLVWAECVNFENQGQSDILVHSTHIIFLNLTELNLCDNKIRDIESIPKLNAPKLKNLFLSQNQISNGKALRKATLGSIATINLRDNLIKQFLWLNEMKLPENMSSLTVDFGDLNGPISCEDLRSIIKNQPVYFKYIFCSAKGRIFQRKVRSSLRHKFNMANLK